MQIRPIISQAIILGIVLGFIALLGRMASSQMTQQGLTFGLDFLWQTVATKIANPIIEDPSRSVALTLLAGLINTVRIAFLACLLATVLGVVAGIVSSTSNPLLRFLTRSYVEIFKNTPVLLQLIVFYSLVLQLPLMKNAWSPVPYVFVTNRGIFIPAIDSDFSFVSWLAAAVIFLAALFLIRRLTSRPALAGTAIANIPFGKVGLTGIAIFYLLTSEVLTPELQKYGYVGGLKLSLEFFTLLIGLVLYKGAQIAEIVRGSIQAVPQGQFEASKVLGLGVFQTYRLIILPYALRIAIPPVTNMYTDIIKLTALGVAIGFAELAAVGQRVLQITGRPFETIGIVMLLYFIVCTLTSFGMNYVNEKAKFVEN